MVLSAGNYDDYATVHDGCERLDPIFLHRIYKFWKLLGGQASLGVLPEIFSLGRFHFLDNRDPDVPRTRGAIRASQLGQHKRLLATKHLFLWMHMLGRFNLCANEPVACGSQQQKVANLA